MNKKFKLQPNVGNGCRHLLIMSMCLKGIAILNIERTNYYGIISGISKSKAINLIQNVDLTKKSKTL